MKMMMWHQLTQFARDHKWALIIALLAVLLVGLYFLIAYYEAWPPFKPDPYTEIFTPESKGADGSEPVYRVENGIHQLKFTLVGAGGGGGGGSAGGRGGDSGISHGSGQSGGGASGTNGGAGGGGGSGDFVLHKLIDVNANDSVKVIVGTGGAGGIGGTSTNASTVSGTDGADGSTTQVYINDVLVLEAIGGMGGKHGHAGVGSFDSGGNPAPDTVHGGWNSFTRVNGGNCIDGWGGQGGYTSGGSLGGRGGDGYFPGNGGDAGHCARSGTRGVGVAGIRGGGYHTFGVEGGDPGVTYSKSADDELIATKGAKGGDGAYGVIGSTLPVEPYSVIARGGAGGTISPLINAKLADLNLGVVGDGGSGGDGELGGIGGAVSTTNVVNEGKWPTKSGGAGMQGAHGRVVMQTLDEKVPLRKRR